MLPVNDRFKPLRSITLRVLAGAALMAGSCAVPLQDTPPGVSSPPSVPAAKLGLPNHLRVFYDELEPYGDWVLIEPYGYVFRPDVNTVAWRPYERGWWEPSDVFGWIWNSDEPFGWLTYHYGTWFRDDYQGWVWGPGSQWGPAWVAWVAVGDWIGWAPLAPVEYDRYSDIPGGVFLYASAAQFGRNDESMRATFVNGLARTNAPLSQIVRLGRADGVTFNKGPDPTFVQRAGGMGTTRNDTPPARLELPSGRDDDGAMLLMRSKRLYAQAEREWQGWRDAGTTPKPVQGGKPRPPVWLDPPTKKPAAKPLGAPTPTDSITRSPATRDSARFKPAPRDTGAGKTRRAGAQRKPSAPGAGGAVPDSSR